MKNEDALIDPIIDLPAEAMERLMEMLENPREPSPALKALFRKHGKGRKASAQKVASAYQKRQDERARKESNLRPGD